MPDTKSLCPPGRARDMRHFGQPTDASACTLCATFAWVPLLHSTPPPSLTEPNPLYYMPWQNLCVPLLLHGSLCPPPAHACPLGLICVAETFQNFTAWCNIKMPSFYDYAADATAAVAAAAAADAAAPAAGAILLNFNGIFSSANCRMH